MEFSHGVVVCRHLSLDPPGTLPQRPGAAEAGAVGTHVHDAQPGEPLKKRHGGSTAPGRRRRRRGGGGPKPPRLRCPGCCVRSSPHGQKTLSFSITPTVIAIVISRRAGVRGFIEAAFSSPGVMATLECMFISAHVIFIFFFLQTISASFSFRDPRISEREVVDCERRFTWCVDDRA